MSAPRQIIEHGEDWKLWVLCDRDPVETWIDGRVALLGDAAHPMLQYYRPGRLHGDGRRGVPRAHAGAHGGDV